MPRAKRAPHPFRARNIYVPAHLQPAWLEAQMVANEHDLALSTLVSLAVVDFLTTHMLSCATCQNVLQSARLSRDGSAPSA